MLQTLLGGLGLAAFGSILYPLLRFLSPAGGGEAGRRLVLRKSDIPAGEAKDIQVNNTPAIVIHRPQKGYIVLSKVCTHLGCLVEFEKAKARLLCPCHAGVYDLDGNVLSGPPPQPLPRIPITVQGDDLVIG